MESWGMMRMAGKWTPRRIDVLAVAATIVAALFMAAWPIPHRHSLAAPPHEQEANDGGPLGIPGPQRKRAHLARLGAERWHQQGKLGQQAKVAILDSGFRGYERYLGKGLPANVQVRSFRHDENLQARDSQHGILCGEIIHALAPKAELLFANWEPDSPEAFLAAVRWAKQEGANIISCSVIMPSWSDGEGGGPVHPPLQKLLGNGKTPGDMLCFASAGNMAERHWFGRLAPRDGWHRWNQADIDNRLTPWGGERVSVECYGPASCDYEVQVLDPLGQCVGRARRPSTGSERSVVVRFEPTADATYTVRIRCPQEVTPSDESSLHVIVLGGSLQHATSRGSIPFPGDGTAVCAIGAVNDRRQRERYSSCGPNSRVPKPDFVATVPFPSACRSYPFTGTSAAAPQAAGLAALLWGSPERTPRDILQALRDAAVDLGPPGHDFDTGYGLIRLPSP